MNTSAANWVAVVLAGGFGTRIRHLAPDLPKPMLPVRGRPFLEWVVRRLATQGLQRVCLSTGHLGNVIEGHFADWTRSSLTVRCVREPRPLGTAGGFRYAARACGWLPDAWLVVNGDSLTATSLSPLGAALDDPEILGALLALEVAETSRYGTLRVDARERLRGFAEKARTGPGLISAGVYLLRPEVLDELPDRDPLSFEADVFPELVARGRSLRVRSCRAPFLDIGTPESLAQAEAFLQSQESELLGA